MGFEVELKNYPPRSIVSLVPSQTELLFDLGLSKEVVGITKFCIHPETWYKTKTRVGGTKDAKIEKITALKPDLVIANKEENTAIIVEACKQHGIPVYISNIYTLQDALKMISDLGVLTHTEEKANIIIETIKQGFNEIKNPKKKLTYTYVIWQNPYMIAAKNTYISNILSLAGLTNSFEQLTRYPEITLEQLEQVNPDVIFLSSEPFPFQQKHIDFFKKRLPKARVMLIDGELISWYGSRLIKTAPYLQKITLELQTDPNHAAAP